MAPGTSVLGAFSFSCNVKSSIPIDFTIALVLSIYFYNFPYEDEHDIPTDL